MDLLSDSTSAMPASSGMLVISNPATGAESGRVEIATPDDVVAAVRSARAEQVAWAEAGWGARAGVLRRFHDLLLERSTEIVDTIQSETGKARRDAMSEVLTTAGTLRHYLAHGRSYLRDRRGRGAAPLITSARVTHDPLGVVGLITPWNYPLLLGVADALPALLAGNAVVIKPSDVTPLTAEHARSLLIEAGLGEQLLQLVHGPGPVVGEALLEHVDCIGFTGSTATGRIIGAAAGRRLIPCSLELGGKNPMLILDGADVANAVSGLLTGAFFNSGQTCISIERLYVADGMWDAVVDELGRRMSSLHVGWSDGWDMDVGCLVSDAHADAVRTRVDEAIAGGATVVAAAEQPSDAPSCCVAPVVLTGVTPDMRLHAEETFGPVVAMYRVASVDEAIALANDTPYGLNASVWAGSTTTARAVARRVSAGSVGINSSLLIYASPDVPMGGIRDSGIGHRHGADGILRYTASKSIVRSVATRGGYETLAGWMTSESRARLLARVYRVWRHLPGAR